jgi:fructokinase
MTAVERPKAFGAGLIALDLVIGLDPQAPVRSWAGGTCGNVLSALAYLGWDSYPIARMNGDPASVRVRDDMARWGVRLDYANCGPTAHTPIIIQEIRRGRDGRPKHRFSWSCPQCGQWLPGFKAVTIEAVEKVTPALNDASVFFLDRLSRATLMLAAQAAERGAVVVFEPSSKATDKLFAEAIGIAHIVKYADQRLAGVQGVMKDGTATVVEVQTLGEQGLKYRHRLGRSVSNWLHLSAIAAPRLADTCGSGDWCTAGLIAKVAGRGQVGLRQSGAQGLRAALRYGQALAAWNCGFEGARGGMYAVTRKAFDQQVTALLAGELDNFTEGAVELGPESIIACPACPPKSPNRRSLGRGRARLKRAAA